MDKRWIGIIVILIIGLGCMYLIVDNSNSVGNAVTVISDVTITLPPGYITSEDGHNHCVFHNKPTNETIRVFCLEEKTNYIKEYNTQLNSLKKESDIIIGKNFTNETLGMIEYENLSSTDRKDIKLVFFDKCDHSFSMKMEHFTNDNNKEYAINFIIDNMVKDFKQNS